MLSLSTQNAIVLAQRRWRGGGLQWVGCEEARLSKGGEFTFQNAPGLRLGLIV